MLWVRAVISLLCAVGFYASVFMLRKFVLGARGELREASVVQTPRAKLFAGVPNMVFGCIYYPAMALVAWSGNPIVLDAALAASLLAAATSAYLAYSLLFVTRRSCPYCWSAHVANWLIFLVLIALVCRANGWV